MGFRDVWYIITLLAYYAYVHSLITFGILAWRGVYKSVIDPLNTVQKNK